MNEHEKLGMIKARKTKLQRILDTDTTKRNRQKIVTLLVQFKILQKKLVVNSKGLSDALNNMGEDLRSIIEFNALCGGHDPEGAIDHLINSHLVFKEGYEAAKHALKVARKRVKNKDYKDE